MNPAQEEKLAEMDARIEHLNRTLQHTQTQLHQIAYDDTSSRRKFEAQLDSISSELSAIPNALANACTLPVQVSTAQCEDLGSIQTVVMSGNKMVVGELERVWVDPPGATITARIDTGAQSSSLHAQKLVAFERDGDDWIRFEVALNGETEHLERKVKRYVRVYQQSDPDGSRRPVIEMRIRLGDVQDTFDFTLADRSHLDYEMLLGRNFLTDVALVDVGRQFIQPRFDSAQE